MNNSRIREISLNLPGDQIHQDSDASLHERIILQCLLQGRQTYEIFVRPSAFGFR